MILQSAEVNKIQTTYLIKISPPSNLSALLEVVAGRLWWVAVPRPSQPWSGLRKTEGRQFGHLMIEEGLVRVGLFTWSLRAALGDADEDQQDEGRREAGEEQESANVLRR